MKKFIQLLREGISNESILRVTQINRSMRKFLQVLVVIFMLLNTVSMNLGTLFAKNINEEYVTLDPTNDVKYPTTSDPDFDASNVEIKNEVIEERTSNSKTFMKVDGTYVVAMYAETVHYLKNGKYEEIDNSLSYQKADDVYTNNKNSYSIQLPQTITKDNSIHLSMDEYSISWRVVNASNAVISINQNQNKTDSTDIRKLEGINQSIQYRTVLPNVDLEYVISGSKIKENIILNSYVKNFSIEFEYELEGLTLTTDSSGKIVFIKPDKTILFYLDDLYMYDAKQNYSTEIELQIEKGENDTYILNIKPNDEW